MRVYTWFYLFFGIVFFTFNSYAQAPTVTSPSATLIGSNGATLGGNITAIGGSAITFYGTAWKTTSPVVVSDNQLAIAGPVATGTFSHARTGLPTGSQIFFVAYATNGTGTTLSGEGSFFTLSNEPTGHPASFTAVTSSSTQINLAFSAASTVAATGYLILRRQDGTNPDATGLVDANAPSLPGGTTLVTTTNAAATTFNDMTVTAGNHYSYAIIPFGYNGTDAQTYNYLTAAGIKTDDDYTLSTEPTGHPASFGATTASPTQIDLSFSAGSTVSATGYLILRRQDGTNPDGTGLVDANAPSLPGGTTLVTTTNAAATTFSDMTVTAGNHYNYAIIPFGYNATDAQTYNYLTTAGIKTDDDYTLSTEPTGHPAAFNATTVSSTQIDLAFSAGSTISASGYLILRRQDGTDPNGTGLTDGSAPGLPGGTTLVTTTNAVVTTFSDMTVTAGNHYNYAIIPIGYNGTDAQTYNYLTTAGIKTDNDYTLSTEPSAHPAAFNAVATSPTQITLTFSAANTISNGSGYIILRRQDGVDPTGANVIDGIAPGSLSLPAGTTLAYTISNAALTTPPSPDNGRTTNTQYNYAIIPFNWDGSNTQTYNYLTSPTILTSSDTPSNGITITPATPTSVCQGTSKTLTDITLAEVANGDISNQGTIILELDNLAYSFVAAQGSININPSPVGGSNNDIDALSMVVNSSRITITFTLDGSNNKKESIIISGIQISYDGSAPASTAHITRIGGTSTINGLTGNLASITGSTTVATPGGTNLTINACQGDVIPTGPNINSNNSLTSWYSDPALLPASKIAALNSVTNINTPVLLSSLGFSTSTVGAITRYVTQNTGCESAALAVTLTVQAKPVADLTITSGSSTLCRNNVDGSLSYENITFTASPSGAANYEFFIGGVSKQNGASRTFTTTSQFINDTDAVTVVVTVTGSCPSTSSPINMTVNSAGPSVNFEIAFPPADTPPTFSAFSNQQDTVRLKGIPAGGVFSGPGINFTTPIPENAYFHPSSLPIGSNYPIVYSVNTGGCISKRTRQFDVYDGTNAIPTLAASYCSQDPDILITIGSRPGYNLQYIYSPNNYSSYYNPYLPVGSIIAANGLDAIDTNYPAWLPPNTPYWNPGPGSTGGPTFTIRPSLISTYNDGIDDGIVTIQFAAAYDLLPADGYPDEVRYQTVKFYTRPSAPVASLSSSSYCTADNIVNNVVNVSSITGATVRWYDNSNFTGERLAISDKSKPTFLELGVVNGVANSYTRYVTQTTNGCQSLPTTVVITVNSNPGAPNISAPPSYCEGQAIADLNVSASGSVKWYTSLSNIPLLATPVSTPLLAAATELGIDKNVAATYTRYVTQTTNLCESTPATISVVVNPIPTPPSVTNANLSFCKNADITSSPPINVTSGSNIKWYRDATLSVASLITPIANQFAATSAELGLSSSIAPSSTLFYITQTNGGCESNLTIVTVTINDLTAVSINITGGQPLSGICKTGDIVKLSASPSGGVWSTSPSNASTALINITSSTADLDPSNANLQPGQAYSIIYSSSGGCANSDSKLATILSSVSPSVIIGDACNGSFVDINNTSVITPAVSSATITSIAWDFGDGDVLLQNLGAIPDGANGGNTKGSFIQPEHQFKGLGSFQIKFNMTTSEGCTITGAQPVQINPVPNVNFTWSNNCLGAGTQFTSIISNGVSIPVSNYDWNFNKENQLSIASSGSGANPIATYSSIGRDSVRLIVTSAFNCKDTVTKPVFITPIALPITDTNSYNENFDSRDGGWVAGGKRSSWANGKPAGAIINRDSSATGNGGAWKTNLSGNYNDNEDSWVLSPCFDFTASRKPVLSLDIWSNTPRGLDGAVLQVNVTGNIEDAGNWTVVGEINRGINWYDQNNINSSPGNQSSLDAGWTGNTDNSKYKKWTHATFALDELVGQPSVKFRVAFAGNVASGEGFAFDNVFIGERSRVVLIENFTNSSIKAGVLARLQNNYFNSTFNNGEVVKIQYHTSFPGEDAINKENRAIYDSRAAFYGLTSVPAARLDGQFRDGNFSDWGDGFYLDRVLDPAPIEIQSIDVQKDATTGFVKINTVLKANAKIPKNAYVQTLIVEKDITNSSYLGENGDAEFRYVAKQMLPSPAGIKITKSLNLGETFTVPELIWEKQNLFTPGSGQIIVFVQRDTITDKRVYQSRLIDNPPHPDLVTGINEISHSSIVIYPNPADHGLTILLPEAAKQDTPFILSDQLGKIVNRASFHVGEKTKTINTHDLTEGLYILKLESGKETIHKKVVIVHQGIN